MVWECQACRYVYNSRKGDMGAGIPEGTSFKDLPEGWKCPVCGVGPEFFEKMHTESH